MAFTQGTEYATCGFIFRIRKKKTSGEDVVGRRNVATIARADGAVTCTQLRCVQDSQGVGM